MQPELPNSLLTWLDQRQCISSHRQLLVVSGEESWGQVIAELLIQNQSFNSVLWSGNRATPEAIPHHHYRHSLGMEFDAVVYNAHSGVRANAMISLSGTVKSHNLMILLCPLLQDWPAFADPERHIRTSYGFSDNEESRFISRLTDLVATDDSVAILTPDTFSASLCPIALKPKNNNDINQQDVVDSIINEKGHPIVVTADRGRGKSSALGMAAASLMKQTKGLSVLITAPNRKAVDKVFKHADMALPNAVTSRLSIEYAESKLSFQAVDAILANQPNADVLLIDEAAAIPNSSLKLLLGIYKRVVFSSTVHGYEGSGRGFELRFKQYLKNDYPNSQLMHLSSPMRWSQGDVLEQFWFDTMLMKAKNRVSEARLPNLSSIDVRQVSQHTLIQHPELLSDVFALLIDAHYQTTPDDLKRLLDAQDIVLLVAMSADTLLGVMLLNKEGGDRLDDLAFGISNGTRRPPGHLVAQQLAYTYALPELATLSYLRIARIAVAPHLQRKGIASVLLREAKSVAAQENVDFLVTSFGLTESLLAFWHFNHFEPIKLGNHIDAASGERSLIMFQSVNASDKQLFELLRGEFQRELEYLLNYKNINLPFSLQNKLKNPTFKHEDECPAHDILLTQFSQGLRPLDSCERAIHQYLDGLTSQVKAQCQKDYLFLRDCVSTDKSTQTLVQQYGLAGKKALTQQARAHLTTLLEKAYLD